MSCSGGQNSHAKRLADADREIAIRSDTSPQELVLDLYLPVGIWTFRHESWARKGLAVFCEESPLHFRHRADAVSDCYRQDPASTVVWFIASVLDTLKLRITQPTFASPVYSSKFRLCGNRFENIVLYHIIIKRLSI